ncbi:MAG: copper-binding protein [Candidatus Acidiferrales bacterium]
MNRHRILLAAVFVAIVGMAAARLAAQGNSNSSDSEKHYVLTGTVQSIDVKNHQVVVDGDDVPGYMDAMPMPYRVPDEKALKALAVGDKIHADLIVKGDDAHLENIKVTAHAKSN